MNRRAYYSAEQRREILSEFETSGLSTTEFARQKGITRTLLPIWRRRYGPGASAPAVTDKVVPWQEVKLQDVLGQPTWAAEVVLPEGITLRLDGLGRSQLLEAFLRRRP